MTHGIPAISRRRSGFWNSFSERRPAAAAFVGLLLGSAAVMAYLGRWRMALAFFLAGLVGFLALIAFAASQFSPLNYWLFAAFHVLGAVVGWVAAKQGSRDAYPFYARRGGLILLFLVLPLGATVLFKSLVYQPYTIPTNSMAPTFQAGDYVLASEFAYGYGRYSFPFLLNTPFFGRHPVRGDVAVFRLPDSENIDYVKRIVGMPGDQVQLRAGTLYLNGEPLPREPVGKITVDGQEFSVFRETLPTGRNYEVMELTDDAQGDNTRNFIVPSGQVFVLGDNRDQSNDSRFALVAYVPLENLFARVDAVFSDKDSVWRRLH